jgi:arginine-tRNA-protein transferase
MQDELGNKQFYITPSHPCSYLPHRDANTLFLDPRETITPGVYQALTEQGFRRSGGHLYRPHCRTCQACIPSRVPVASFKAKRRQKRVLTRNEDLRIEIKPAAFSAATYGLYARYIAGRHGDGDMYPPSEDQFRSFLLSQWSDTLFVCSYQDEDLIAVAVTDRQPGGLSAIYTFFEPTESRRSLGVWSILQQIELSRQFGLPYLYLGYWIRDSAKMRYKTDYRPVELFVNGHWITVV